MQGPKCKGRADKMDILNKSAVLGLHWDVQFATAYDPQQPYYLVIVVVWNPSPSSLTLGAQVGVVGLGGLGHLAIQFLAKAVGAEVFAISHSPNKKEEALSLGATHFIGLEDIKDNSLDVVLNTTPG